MRTSVRLLTVIVLASLGTIGAAHATAAQTGPAVGGWLYDSFGSYFWLFVASCGIGLGAVAIGLTFRPPSVAPAALPGPTVARLSG